MREKTHSQNNSQINIINNFITLKTVSGFLISTVLYDVKFWTKTESETNKPFPFDVRSLKYLKILETFLNLAFYTYLLNAPKSFSHISFILRTDIIVSSLPLSSYSRYLFYLSYIFCHFLPACLSKRTSPTQLPAYSRLLGDACDVCWVRSW